MSAKILTTLVGSYPVPAWLQALPSCQALEDAASVVLKLQENAGIDLIVDGELYRFDVNHPETNGMIEYFVKPLGNVRSGITRSDLANFHMLEGMGFRTRPSAVVTGKIDEGTLNLVEDYQRVSQLTKAPLKFTLTGPHMLCKTLLDQHYGSPEALCRALAEVLGGQVADINAPVVQVDEANITGHPDEAPWAASCINQVLDSVKTTAAMHLCFGNYGGQSIQDGHWSKLVGFMNDLHCDHILVELAFRGERELEFFSQTSERVKFGIGVVDIKTNVVETPEVIAGRIEQAAKILSPERIAYVNPDCGFWMLGRGVSDRKIAALVAGRDLFEGR